MPTEYLYCVQNYDHKQAKGTLNIIVNQLKISDADYISFLLGFKRYKTFKLSINQKATREQIEFIFSQIENKIKRVTVDMFFQKNVFIQKM